MCTAFLIRVHQRVEAVQLSFQGPVSQSLKPTTASERFSRRAWLRGVAHPQLSVPLFRPLKDTLEGFCRESHSPPPPASSCRRDRDTRAGRGVLSQWVQRGSPASPAPRLPWGPDKHGPVLCARPGKPPRSSWRPLKVVCLDALPLSLTPSSGSSEKGKLQPARAPGPASQECCVFLLTASSPGRPLSQTHFLLQ